MSKKMQPIEPAERLKIAELLKDSTDKEYLNLF